MQSSKGVMIKKTAKTDLEYRCYVLRIKSKNFVEKSVIFSNR